MVDNQYGFSTIFCTLGFSYYTAKTIVYYLCVYDIKSDVYITGIKLL